MTSAPAQLRAELKAYPARVEPAHRTDLVRAIIVDARGRTTTVIELMLPRTAHDHHCTALTPPRLRAQRGAPAKPGRRAGEADHL